MSYSINEEKVLEKAYLSIIFFFILENIFLVKSLDLCCRYETLLGNKIISSYLRYKIHFMNNGYDR